MDLEEHFSSRAESYDHRREDVIPGFDSLYDTFPEVTEPGRTLDLGAGTGILSTRLRDAGHDVVLLDLSRDMLRQARAKGLRETVRGEMTHLPIRGPVDNVVSCLAIHHLETREKRELYRAVFDLLRPGGSFVHGDMVRAPTDALQRRYMALWRRRMEEKGLEDRAESFVEDAETYDVYEPLPDHLDWLRGAGFRDVDCFWKRYNFAVFGGRKPG